MTGIKFRLFGIPVAIESSFFVVAVLLGLGSRSVTFVAIWVPVVFISVLAHELGHALACRVFRQRPRILLQGMTGLTFHSGPLTWGREIVISLAGPLTGIALGAPALWFQQSSGHLASPWGTVLRIVVFVNVAWSVVNLLPVLPLDGGNVAVSLLRRVNGASGERAAYVVSMVVAGAGAIVAYRLKYPFGALFALFFVGQNYQSLKQARATGERAPLVAGFDALVRNDLATAVSQADKVLATTPAPDVAALAVELKAWAGFCSDGGAAAASAVLEAMPAGATTNSFLAGSLALDEGRRAEAVDHYATAFSLGQLGPWNVIVAEAVVRCGLVDELADRLAATPEAGTGALVAFQSHLHLAGRFPEAASIGRRAFEAGPEHPALVAYNVACSLARAGSTDAAIDWLERAATTGLDDPALLDRDPDLASLRGSPRYQTVRAMATNKAGTPPVPPSAPLP